MVRLSGFLKEYSSAMADDELTRIFAQNQQD